MAYTLILKNGQNINFEELYQRAIALVDGDAALQLIRSHKRAGASPRFWQQTYLKGGYQDLSLMSAIIFELDMPFGAYVIIRQEEDLIEVVPWLFSTNVDRSTVVDEVFTGSASSDEFRSFARTLTLTADYLDWLEGFYSKHGEKKG